MVVCVTLRQPWASLFMKGLKCVDVRRWCPSFRGELYIHAGKGLDQDYCRFFELNPLTLPSGMLVAKGNLVDVVKFDTKEDFLDMETSHLCFPEMWSGPCYGWVLDDVVKVPFVQVRGKQGLWSMDLPEVSPWNI